MVRTFSPRRGRGVDGGVFAFPCICIFGISLGDERKVHAAPNHRRTLAIFMQMERFDWVFRPRARISRVALALCPAAGVTPA